MNKIRRFLYLCLNYLFAKLPVKRDRVYFYNIWGKYNDSTKALYEEMKRRHPDYEYIYELKDVKGQLPQGIKFVKKNSIASLYYKMTSKIVFDNDYGCVKWRGDYLRAKKMAWLFKGCIQKKSVNFSVGHGTFIKTVGFDRKLDNYDVYISSTSYMCVSNRHWKDTTERNTFGVISNYLLTGSPRNDYLFSDDAEKERVKKQNHLQRKKIAIIAPTFRTEIRNGVTYHLGADDFIQAVKDNSERLVSALHERFGGDWILGLRIHPGIEAGKLESTNYLFSANEMPDINDYLLIADMLITDYSSCAFDMAITFKPCILLWEDEENYRNKEQGLYFTRDQLPFPVADNMLQLEKCILQFDSYLYEVKLKEHFDKYEMFVGHDSSERIVNCVDQVLGNTDYDYIDSYRMR